MLIESICIQDKFHSSQPIVAETLLLAAPHFHSSSLNSYCIQTGQVCHHKATARIGLQWSLSISLFVCQVQIASFKL
jgi:hypothetical protein